MGGTHSDWIALHLAPGIGDRRKRKLVERLGGPGAVFRASAEEVAGAAGCGIERARTFLRGRTDPEPVLRETERAGGAVLVFDDPAYPLLLKETHDPPLVLFARGDTAVLSRPAVAVVGARRADPGAAGWTEKMGSVLARSGFLVASGFACGIDAAAHRGALAGGGTTAAVLGTGIDICYPEGHAALADAIAKSGVLLTELPPGAGPLAPHFPKRNRILAGLAVGVVVVQAAEKSGAMITARLALEAGREVFVVAGPPWEPRFAGNRRLAREGAPVVQDGEEAALLLGATPPEAPSEGTLPLDLAGVDRQVALALSDGPRTNDEICRATGRLPSEVLPLLLRLELAGLVEERAGRLFALAGAS